LDGGWDWKDGAFDKEGVFDTLVLVWDDGNELGQSDTEG